MFPHAFTFFEIQMYYHSELKIKVVYSKNNLRAPTKDGTYMLNLDDYKSLETHWIYLHAMVTVWPPLIVLVLNIFQKKSDFIKERETTKLLSQFSIGNLLGKIILLE